MASKLLNVLNDIEKGRKHCINVARDNNLKIDDNASIYAIGDTFNNMVLMDNNNVVSIPDITGYTKENDPAVWHRPKDWINLEEIFTSTGDIDIIDYSGNNRKAAPVYAVLLKNDTPQIEFTTNTINSSTETVVGTANIGHFPSYSNYKETKAIVTSDGAKYVIHSENPSPVVHVWDETKDIVHGEDTYRWFIVYHYDSYQTQSIGNLYLGNLHLLGVNVVEFIYSGVRGYNGTIYLPRTCENFVTLSPFSEEAVKYPKSSNNIPLKQSVVGTTNYSSIQSYINKITTTGISISTNDYYSLKNIEYTNGNVNLTACGRAAYVKAKTITFANGTLHYFSNGNNIKYLEATDIEAQKLIPCAGVVDLPNIVEENVFDLITTINHSIVQNERLGVIGRIGMNNHLLSFANLETINPMSSNNIFNQLNCDILFLPKLKGSLPAMPYVYVRKMIIPSITTISVNNPFTFALLYLDISGVREITASTIYQTDSNNNHRSNLEYIDASSLETLTYANYFAGANRLKTLVLKDGFKFNLNLAGNIDLTKECLLDILNKCAQLEDGENYTITLYSRVKASMLSPEEIAIATNKGWTVA